MCHPYTVSGTVKWYCQRIQALLWFPFGFWNASAMIFAFGETTHLGCGTDYGSSCNGDGNEELILLICGNRRVPFILNGRR